MSCLYILGIKPLLVASLANIFSQSICCLVPCISNVKERKFLGELPGKEESKCTRSPGLSLTCREVGLNQVELGAPWN